MQWAHEVILGDDAVWKGIASPKWVEAYWPKGSGQPFYIMRFDHEPENWYLVAHGHQFKDVVAGPFVDVEEAKAVYLIAGYYVPEEARDAVDTL